MIDLGEPTAGVPDPTAPLSATGNLRRRAFVSRTLVFGATGSAVLAVAALVLVVYGVVDRGASAINWNFLTTNPNPLGGGGIASVIIGTGLIVAVATVFAVPIGVLTALFLTEFAGVGPRASQALRMTLDLIQGLPTIVIGLFVFNLMVNHSGDTGVAGSIALAIVMVPLIARSSQEQLQLVPRAMRDAADALGVPRWRSTLGVVLPAARSGIVTGTILALARAAGETAPLLICDDIFNEAHTTVNIFGIGTPNIPVYILEQSDVGSQSAFTQAWGAALVLLTMILVLNVGARIWLARSATRQTR
jgi:phosphate transport system permease protein